MQMVILKWRSITAGSLQWPSASDLHLLPLHVALLQILFNVLAPLTFHFFHSHRAKVFPKLLRIKVNDKGYTVVCKVPSVALKARFKGNGSAAPWTSLPHLQYHKILAELVSQMPPQHCNQFPCFFSVWLAAQFLCVWHTF